LDKAYIRVLSQPNLESPVLLVGLPGIGNIGVIAARLLIEFSHAEPFVEMYSPVLPDYTTVNENGLCSLLRYRFFASKRGRDLLILLGDAQPPIEDFSAYYEVCGEILDFIGELGCKRIITVYGFPAIYAQRTIYVAGTSREFVSECVSMGAKVYGGGRIVGIPGLLLGLARVRGINGVCLLSPAVNLAADREATLNLCGFLRKLLRLDEEDIV